MDEPQQQMGSVSAVNGPTQSVSGALQYLYQQFQVVEGKQNEWVCERNELTARIAYLEGERRGWELARDALLKRVKMLEHCLATQGLSSPGGTAKTVELQPQQESRRVEMSKCRRILREYLEEVGVDESTDLNHMIHRETVTQIVRKQQQQQQQQSQQIQAQQQSPVLSHAPVPAYQPSPDAKQSQQQKEDDSWDNVFESKSTVSDQENSTGTIVKPKLQQPGEDGLAAQGQKFSSWKSKKKKKSPFNTQVVDVNSAQSGELASLSIDDASEAPAADKDERKALAELKLWKPKFTLKSHFDSVRCAEFHSTELQVLSGSEDGTVKLWSIAPYVAHKKSVDIEPLHTFRQHQGSVNCLTFSTLVPDANAEHKHGIFVSGGNDGAVNVWAMPPPSLVAYGKYDYKRYLLANLEQSHDDIVWDCKFHSVASLFVSASHDRVLVHRLEDVVAGKRSLTVMKVSTQEHGAVTSVDFSKTDVNKLIVATSHAHVLMYDVETQKLVQQYQPAEEANKDGLQQINKLVAHPHQQACVSAHEDRIVRFYDTRDLRTSQEMVAHLDAVAGVDVSPDGQTMVTCGHDASVRMWSWQQRQCLQEFSAHRKKYDESIHVAKFHPRRTPAMDGGLSGGAGWLCTGGADSCVKVYAFQ